MPVLNEPVPAIQLEAVPVKVAIVRLTFREVHQCKNVVDDIVKRLVVGEHTMKECAGMCDNCSELLGCGNGQRHSDSV